ncbi:MAG: DUF58 domain-containing protein [Verrucomicrobium sp.]
MSRELLDADAVSHGESLGIMARKIVEGYRVGEHRSPFHGFAIEFAQHREYSPGDDTRHLDWKILGRTDRYYIKQYEQDTNYITHLVVDGSTSMNYGSPAADGSKRLNKLQYAKVLAACFAYIILHQRDAVALALVDKEVREYLRRTDSLQRLPLILDRLAAFQGSKDTRLGVALDQVAAESRRRGIVMIFSDLFDDEEALIKGLEKLTYSGQEVIVFHTLDPHELTFPFEGTWRFHDLEGTDEIQTTPADFRASYLKNFQEFRDRIRAACDRFQAHYVLADTEKSVSETLTGYLAFRSSVRRK